MGRPGDDTSSNETINYPLDTMRSVASEILAKVGLALYTHDQTWSSIQTYIQDSAPTYSASELGGSDLSGHLVDVRSYLTNVLEPHAKRLRASYEWQLKVASALFDAVETVETTEQAIVQSLTPGSPPDDTTVSGPYGHGPVR